MWAKKASSDCYSLISTSISNKGGRLGLHPAISGFPFSSKASDSPPPALGPAPFDPHRRHVQARNFASAAGVPPRQPPVSAAVPAAAPGMDYLSLFQPAYGNALTGLGAFSPGSVLKVYPLPRFVLKEDIIHHLRGSNVQPESIKFVYNTTFRPDYVQFDVDSASTQRQIMKRLQERGRLGCRYLKAEVSPPVPWTFVDAALKDSPRGRTLVMYNVSANTDFEDVERFFTGYNYDPSCIRFIKVSNEQVQTRGLRRPTSHHVAVGFTTKLEALRAMREKMGEFCANMVVNLRLIQ